MTSIKKIVRKIIGERALGVVDYFRPRRHRYYSKYYGAPFNGQKIRRCIFNDIINKTKFKLIVETGTFSGATTGCMHQISGLPVYTVELDDRCYAYSKMRYLLNTNIKVFNGDSRKFLILLSTKYKLKNERIFFYLDAHRNLDLPLCQEIEVIFKNWAKAVIMIDDFQVPFDEGYGFDSYETGEELSLSLLMSINSGSFSIFFPSEASSLETGHRRGCVVLAKDTSTIDVLKGVNGLLYFEN